MLWRTLTFLLFQLLAGLFGWWRYGFAGALVAVVLAGWCWLLADAWRGLRILAWLRQGELVEAPSMWGLWGELADRMRRQLRRRDQTVAESEARLQEFLAALQASPNGVTLLDVDGRIEWCNQTAAAHFGIQLGRDAQQLIGNLVRDPGFSAYLGSQATGHELLLEGRDSTPARPVRISVQLHGYGHGRRLLLSRDVTAIEQAEAMRRDFVANVSHEIRTPLTVVAGFIETLQTLPLPPQEQARYLRLMAEQSGRMQSLVSDLLTLSSLEGSPAPGMQEWCKVQALTGQCARDAQALSALLLPADALPHRFMFVPPAQALELAGRYSELLSAMSNLVSNAVRYTPAGGSITVRWETQADGGAEFSVRDTGLGIAPEHLARVTERFYRVDRSRSRETGGTGLGLAIVKHVVQRHGAELRISSEPGAGSLFVVRFPPSRVRLERVGVAGA